MSQVITKILSVLMMTIVAGCAIDGSVTKEELNARTQAIENRYAQAVEVYKQKMAPIAGYIVNICGPMADREYIECINAKRTEIKTSSIYPENASTRDQRMALEGQLVDKKISRKEFRAKLEDIKNRHDAKRLQQDIAAGIYSGQY